jgi:hypothetical protein
MPENVGLYVVALVVGIFAGMLGWPILEMVLQRREKEKVDRVEQNRRDEAFSRDFREALDMLHKAAGYLNLDPDVYRLFARVWAGRAYYPTEILETMVQEAVVLASVWTDTDDCGRLSVFGRPEANGRAGAPEQFDSYWFGFYESSIATYCIAVAELLLWLERDVVLNPATKNNDVDVYVDVDFVDAGFDDKTLGVSHIGLYAGSCIKEVSVYECMARQHREQLVALRNSGAKALKTGRLGFVGTATKN